MERNWLISEESTKSAAEPLGSSPGRPGPPPPTPDDISTPTKSQDVIKFSEVRHEARIHGEYLKRLVEH
jgi:hypothetical protein